MPQRENQTSFKKGHAFIKGGEKGWFKKGHKTWNTGTEGLTGANKTSFKKGQVPWNKGLKGYGEGETHPYWKGEDASYISKHSWLKRKYGNPKECVDCGEKGKHILSKNGIKKWNIDWSNVDGKYRRKKKDYQGRCRKCHKKYDLQLKK